MDEQNFFELAFTKPVACSALKVALLVGSLLALINYGDKLLASEMVEVDWLKLGLTYFVPYAVSTYSAVRAIQNK